MVLPLQIIHMHTCYTIHWIKIINKLLHINPNQDFPINLLLFPQSVDFFTQFWSCMCFKKALPRAHELCNHVIIGTTQTWPLKLSTAPKYTTISFHNRQERVREKSVHINQSILKTSFHEPALCLKEMLRCFHYK